MLLQKIKFKFIRPKYLRLFTLYWSDFETFTFKLEASLHIRKQGFLYRGIEHSLNRDITSDYIIGDSLYWTSFSSSSKS